MCTAGRYRDLAGAGTKAGALMQGKVAPASACRGAPPYPGRGRDKLGTLTPRSPPPSKPLEIVITHRLQHHSHSFPPATRVMRHAVHPTHSRAVCAVWGLRVLSRPAPMSSKYRTESFPRTVEIREMTGFRHMESERVRSYHLHDFCQTDIRPLTRRLPTAPRLVPCAHESPTAHCRAVARRFQRPPHESLKIQRSAPTRTQRHRPHGQTRLLVGTVSPDLTSCALPRQHQHLGSPSRVVHRHVPGTGNGMTGCRGCHSIARADARRDIPATEASAIPTHAPSSQRQSKN